MLPAREAANGCTISGSCDNSVCEKAWCCRAEVPKCPSKFTLRAFSSTLVAAPVLQFERMHTFSHKLPGTACVHSIRHPRLSLLCKQVHGSARLYASK
jgi:hypothetical protein